MNMRRKLAPRFNLKQLTTPREDTVSLRPSIKQTHRPKPRSTGSNPINPQARRPIILHTLSKCFKDLIAFSRIWLEILIIHIARKMDPVGEQCFAFAICILRYIIISEMLVTIKRSP